MFEEHKIDYSSIRYSRGDPLELEAPVLPSESWCHPSLNDSGMYDNSCVPQQRAIDSASHIICMHVITQGSPHTGREWSAPTTTQ